MNDKEEFAVAGVVCVLVLIIFGVMCYFVGQMGANLQAVLHKHGL